MSNSVKFSLPWKLKAKPKPSPELGFKQLSHILNVLCDPHTVDQCLVDFINTYVNEQQQSVIVVDQLIGFNPKQMLKKHVYLIEEKNTTYLYGVVYKVGGKIHYKNSSGSQACYLLKTLLDHYTASDGKTRTTLVNNRYDGLSVKAKLMAIYNAFHIARIAHQSKDDFRETIGFAVSEDMDKYKKKILTTIFIHMVEPLNISTLSNLGKEKKVLAFIVKQLQISDLCNLFPLHEKFIEELRECKLQYEPAMLTNEKKVPDYENALFAINNNIETRKFQQLFQQLKNTIKDMNGLTIIVEKHLPESVKNNPNAEMDKIISDIAKCHHIMKQTKHIELRDVQLMAILLAFMDDNHTFLEIKTGEGKTVVIAIISAIKSKQGKSVDIITSNEQLAKSNYKEIIEFYDALEITCSFLRDKDNSTEAETAYSKSIVYGSIRQFMFDYLQNCMNIKDNCRNERGYDCCILDEVDLLTIDNAKQLAKIAEPFPGMEMLMPLYELLLKGADEELLRKVPIPDYLQVYRDFMMPKWIKNVSNFRTKYCKDVHYIVKNKIVPIDVENTGSILSNSVFTDGIQQFLELMHLSNIRRFESMNSIFISNFGYLRLYQQPLFGVSGTTGSHEEQDILKEMFGNNMHFYKIPSHHLILFKENELISTYGWEWNMIEHAEGTIKGDKLTKVIFFTTEELCRRLNCVLQIKSISKDKIKFCSHHEDLHKIANEWQEERSVCQIYIPIKETTSETKQPMLNETGIEHNQCIAYVDEQSHIWARLDASCCIMATKNDNYFGIRSICNIGICLSSVEKQVYLGEFRKICNDLLDMDKDVDCDLFIYSQQVDKCEIGVDNERATHFNEYKIMKRELANKAINRNVFVAYLIERRYQSTATKIERGCISAHEFSQLTIKSIVLNVKYNEQIKYYYPSNAFLKTNHYHHEVINKYVNHICKEKKSALVICEHISQVNELQKLLTNKNVFTYTGDDNKRKVKANTFCISQEIEEEQIILTTNIGGRGVDFKTSTTLENNGGLQVVLAFMPINKRVELQAFGRTARNGCQGSGQIIFDAIKFLSSALKNQNMKCKPPNMKFHRDRVYETRLKADYNKRLDRTRFNDNICKLYIEMYKHFQTEAETLPELQFRMKDVNEFWSFWLRRKNDADVDAKLDPLQKFADFRQEAINIIEGTQFFNPIYCIQRAIYYYNQDKVIEAQKLIEDSMHQNCLSDSTISQYFCFIAMAILKNNSLEFAHEILLKIEAFDHQRNKEFKRAFNEFYLKYKIEDWSEMITACKIALLLEKSKNGAIAEIQCSENFTHEEWEEELTKRSQELNKCLTNGEKWLGVFFLVIRAACGLYCGDYGNALMAVNNIIKMFQESTISSNVQTHSEKDMMPAIINLITKSFPMCHQYPDERDMFEPNHFISKNELINKNMKRSISMINLKLRQDQLAEKILDELQMEDSIDHSEKTCYKINFQKYITILRDIIHGFTVVFETITDIQENYEKVKEFFY